MTAPEDPTILPIFAGLPPAADPADTVSMLPGGRPPASRRPATRGLAGRADRPPAAAPPAGTATGRWSVHLPPASPATPPAPPDGVEASAEPGERDGEVVVDWQQVRLLRAQASDQLTAALGGQRSSDREADRELGRAIIAELVHAAAADRAHDGLQPWTLSEQDQLAEAVFHALFGLGRLQPLLDDDTVENIIIISARRVWLEKTDGTLVRVPPVADSDEELIDFLAFIASRSERNPRPFSPAHPRLHMRLDDGSRLAAAAWTTAHPSVVIRRHRLRRVTLDELADRNMISPVQASFLAAAIRARKSIVVSGPQGSGKALALDTPVPTPTGWTTMGALNAGDLVFAEDGVPCTVLAAHSYQYHRPCYEVEFDDGTTVTADADHLWRVTRRCHRDAATPRRRRNRNDAPLYDVEAAERARLWALADRAGAETDRQVTEAEFAAEAGQHHRRVIHQQAQRMSPAGHTYLSWICNDGRRGGRPMLTYSRQALAKALAVGRDTPRRTKPRIPASVVLSTREIAQTPLWAYADRPWRAREFAIPMSSAVQYSPADQVIDPYVLGVWLGDGTSAQARISTADPEVLAEFEKAGYPCTKIGRCGYDYRVGGNLYMQLRTAGLLGDKHIPATYLRGSVDQRLALLHGLMDSDGTCTAAGGCTFDSTLQVLAEQTHQLVCSLGYKAHLRSKPVIWKGQRTGTSWSVSWTTHDPMFRLPRKRNRQANSKLGGPTQRYIVAVREVPSVPVRCITVDSPSSLFLVTKAFVPTHNTTLLRALAREMPTWEAIGTFESEFELHLHELEDEHPLVHAWESRPGSGEVGPDGRQAGEFSLDEGLFDSFRFNLSRQIVGEVRGREVWAMIKAMESSAGGLSTTHAANAEAAIRKLVTCAMEVGPRVSRELATDKLAEVIDLVVHIHLETVPLGHGAWRRSRWVSEILHVTPGEAFKGYATTRVFRPDPAGGPALPGTLPEELRDLQRYGFDLAGYLADPAGQELAG